MTTDVAKVAKLVMYPYSVARLGWPTGMTAKGSLLLSASQKVKSAAHYNVTLCYDTLMRPQIQSIPHR